jgi:hypothetical protein
VIPPVPRDCLKQGIYPFFTDLVPEGCFPPGWGIAVESFPKDVFELFKRSFTTSRDKRPSLSEWRLAFKKWHRKYALWNFFFEGPGGWF